MTTDIRPYRPEDRAALRALALDTADRGATPPDFFPDREAVADLLTRYYLEREAESVFVAETEGRLTAYLTGTTDTPRYLAAMGRSIVPRAFWGALRRGAMTGPSWILLVKTLLASARLGGNYRTKALLRSYPAHLHINTAPETRGQGVGHRLAEAFFRRAEAAGASGIHLAARIDNAGARRFFESLGFKNLTSHSLAWPESGQVDVHEIIVYGKSL